MRGAGIHSYGQSIDTAQLRRDSHRLKKTVGWNGSAEVGMMGDSHFRHLGYGQRRRQSHVTTQLRTDDETQSDERETAEERVGPNSSMVVTMAVSLAHL